MSLVLGQSYDSPSASDPEEYGKMNDKNLLRIDSTVETKQTTTPWFLVLECIIDSATNTGKHDMVYTGGDF